METSKNTNPLLMILLFGTVGILITVGIQLIIRYVHEVHRALFLIANAMPKNAELEKIVGGNDIDGCVFAGALLVIPQLVMMLIIPSLSKKEKE